MAEYNIDEIEFEDDSEKHASVEEMLTGEVIKGLRPGSGIEPNAELEKNEYIQFPDGVTQKVVGERHEKGGVKMSIPDGTKVVSDHLELGKLRAKKLEKEFGLKVLPTDTFAKVIDKFTAKIGLKKLNEEQEDLFETLKKELSKKMDPKTADVNREYLSKKINQIEQKKSGLEKQRAEFFNVVFKMQEELKKDKGMENDADSMKLGGTSEKNFELVCKKYGLTKEQGMKILENGGYVIDKYDKGGGHGDPKFKFTYKSNKYKPEERVRQSAKPGVGYGNVQSPEDALQQLYNNFPDIVTDVFAHYVDVDDTGTVKFKGGIDLGKQQAAVLALQKKINARMVQTASSVYNDETLPQEVKDEARKWLETEQFTGDVSDNQTEEDRVRSYDRMLGQFTAGRTIMGVDLVTPEDKAKLEKKGIRTFNQITPEILETLSDESKKRYEAFKPKVKPGSDFFLDEYQLKTEGEKDETKPPADGDVAEGTPITDKVNVPFQGRRPPRLFYTPDQSVLPPSPMAAHLKGDVRLERIDPVRIGIEQQIQEVAEQRNFATKQIANLPETQRAAVLANLLANSGAVLNKAATNANVINAEAQSKAELFNIGQAGNEALYGLNNALSYEQRQLTAQAKTEEELRRYYDFNRDVNLNNFSNQQQLNLMDSLYPDASLDFFGMATNYDPTNPFQIQDRRDYLNFLALQNNYTNPNAGTGTEAGV